MAIAFGQFDEPFAWLIRGLVEYNWQDISLSPNKFPKNTGMGFDYNTLIRTTGLSGIRLIAMAIDAQGIWDEEDKIYRFTVKLGQDQWGRPAFSVRSVETAFEAMYPYDPNNPLYSAGYITQGLQEHIPKFMQDKRNGVFISQSQINELRDINSHPCSEALVFFLRDRVQYQLSMNSPAREGLWQSQYQQQTPNYQPNEPEESHWVQQGAESLENQHQVVNTPAIQVGITQGAGQGFRIAGRHADGRIEVANAQGAAALDEVKAPARALQFMSIMGFIFGGLCLINAFWTQLMIRADATVRDVESYKPIVFNSVILGIIAIIAAYFSLKGSKDYRSVKQSHLALFSILFAGINPFCWPVGLPIAIWAAIVWRKPSVKLTRMG